MARPGRGGDDDEARLISPVAVGDVVDGDDDVLVLGERRLAHTWLITAGIAALIAALVVGAILRRPGHHAAAPVPSALPSGTPMAPPQQDVSIGSRVDLGQTSAVDLAMAHGLLYVLGQNPSRLGQVDAVTGRLNRQVAAPTGGQQVVVDRSGQQLWIIADDVVYSYDAPTLTRLGQVELSQAIVSAAPLDGRLYVGTDHGIYVTSAQGSAATLVPGFSGRVVQTFGVDAVRHRLLAVNDIYQLLEVRNGRVRMVRQLQPPLPESIAITDTGSIWSVGFGMVNGPRTGRIDPRTLKITPIGPGDADAPQGAQGWPGQDVFWVKYNYFDSVTCRDARTGAVIRSYLADGPVLSMRGAIYAIRSTTVIRMPTTGQCTG